jgi:sugar O-acyltransferase (sialic acid O-acetyltransferase NeuD family)
LGNLNLQRRIVIIGGQNSGGLVEDAVSTVTNEGSGTKLVGFLNDEQPQSSKICGFPVLGRLDDWIRLDFSTSFIAAIQHPDAMAATARRIANLGIPIERWSSVVHASASVSRGATVSPGVYVGPGAIIMPRACIGWNTSIRGGCYISHDVRIGLHCHIGANAVVNGMTTIGDAVFIGALAFIANGLTIGDEAHVAPGAAVFGSMKDRTKAIGNPARFMKATEENVGAVVRDGGS